MLPFLRILAQHTPANMMLLYIITTGLIYSFNVINIFAGYTIIMFNTMALFNHPWASNCWSIIFSMSGFFIIKLLKQTDKHTQRKWIMYLMLLAAASLVVGVPLFIDESFHPIPNKLETIRQHLIYFPSCFIFASTVYLLPERTNACWGITKVISELSMSSLTVYIIETHTFLPSIIGTFLQTHNYFNLSPYIQAMEEVIVSFIVFSAIGSVVRRVPGLTFIL